MTDFTKTPEIQDAQIGAEVQKILKSAGAGYDALSIYAEVLGMIDLTTLEGADTREKVRAMCRKALSFEAMKLGLPNVAAVCVYPTLIAPAREVLDGTGIRIAAVAGAFPAGQSPISIKLAEVKYAVDQGAHEIDMVISRGRFLEGEYNVVFDEIAAIREACGEAHLKVILETGELKTATNIRRASEIALQAGAHFLKTSTGKIQPAATLEATLVMIQAIKDHHAASGQMVGYKPAGGIVDPETAFQYYVLIDHVLGPDWMNRNYLRFGASRLADQLVDAVRTSKK